MVADLEMLGLDEIALKKGQGHYVTLITGRFADGEIVILGVLPGHEKAMVVEFLRLIPQRSCKGCDRCAVICGKPTPRRYGKNSRPCGLLRIVFMWPEHYRDAADEVRKQELHRLKKELSEEAYKTLKGSMHAFRKNARDLNNWTFDNLKRLV